MTLTDEEIKAEVRQPHATPMPATPAPWTTAQQRDGEGMFVAVFTHEQLVEYGRLCIAAHDERLRQQDPVAIVRDTLIEECDGQEGSLFEGMLLYAAPIPTVTPSQQENPHYPEFETWWSKEFPALAAECYESEMRVAISAWNASRAALRERPEGEKK